MSEPLGLKTTQKYKCLVILVFSQIANDKIV